jgi:ribosomal protein S18 acetylase RimI-like enzyme
MAALTFRPLELLSKADRDTWREVIRGTPSFNYYSQGRPPNDADADRLMDMPDPSGRTGTVYIYALYADAALCGCVHLIRGYPTAADTTLTWLLIMEKFQRSNLSLRAFRRAEEIVQAWGCDQIVGVVAASNERAWRFWQRLGVKEVRRFTLPDVAGDMIVCRCPPLAQNAAISRPSTVRLRQPL